MSNNISLFCANFVARPCFRCDVITGNQISLHTCVVVINSMSSRKKGASAKSGGFYCVAGGPNQQSCKNSTSTEGISMHAFPSDKETRKKWVDFVRRHRPHFQPTRYSALCSIHFEAQCFNRMFSLADLEGESGSSSFAKSKRRLEKGSVPTIHAANEPEQKESVSERSHRQVRAPVVPAHNFYTAFINFSLRLK